MRSACRHCHGEGRIISTPCRDCRGTGTTTRTQTVSVQVPAGTHTYMSISVCWMQCSTLLLVICLWHELYLHLYIHTVQPHIFVLILEISAK